MQANNETISIHALFASDGINPNLESDPRGMLDGADLIFGVDTMSHREFLVYGRDSLQEVVKSGRARQMSVVRIELDQDTTELELLIALVRVMKGKDDYS
jgi:hypothetical protein